jgi:hypothetical protein
VSFGEATSVLAAGEKNR